MGVAILYPVFAQIALTFYLLFRMAYMRTTLLKSREVRAGDIALDNSRWPDRPRQFANAYANQFELPVLFYVLCLIATQTGAGANIFLVILAWAFVVTRLVHAYIHTTSNRVMRRGTAFGLGGLILLIMAVIELLRLLAAKL
jgi:hypothetical protein